jgi:isocitrate dehydrogenase
MMLDYMGWKPAADIIRKSLQETIKARTVTYDLARQIAGATEISCSAFGDAMVERMGG